jgi:adenylate kinase
MQIDFDVVFIAGPQGAGKGTQGKRLAEKLGFLFWGMGSILRDMSKENNELAKHLKAINEGTLLSDEVIIGVTKEGLALVPPGRGIIFDGIPRRPGQAEFLVNFLKEQKRKKPVTIFIDLPRDTSVKRLLLRAKQESRVDDTPEGIDMRFRYYDEDMKPTIAYLERETNFMRIDGTPSPKEVARNIDVALGLT